MKPISLMLALVLCLCLCPAVRAEGEMPAPQVFTSGDDAFIGCESLTGVTIPGSVQRSFPSLRSCQDDKGEGLLCRGHSRMARRQSVGCAVDTGGS